MSEKMRIQKLLGKRHVEVAVTFNVAVLPPTHCAGVDSPTDLRFANGTSTEIF